MAFLSTLTGNPDTNKPVLHVRLTGQFHASKFQNLLKWGTKFYQHFRYTKHVPRPLASPSKGAKDQGYTFAFLQRGWVKVFCFKNFSSFSPFMSQAFLRIASLLCTSHSSCNSCAN